MQDTLQWRHNERDGVSNPQPHDWLLNRLFKAQKISKPRVTGLCEGNSPVTGEFPAQRASNAGNVSIWWRHHEVPVAVTRLSTDVLCCYLSWYPVMWPNHCNSFHDDVIKWKHFPRYWTFVWGIHRSPMNSPHKGQWRCALMFSFICTWIYGWVNNREAGDLRRHRAHYDVSVDDIYGYSIFK